MANRARYETNKKGVSLSLTQEAVYKLDMLAQALGKSRSEFVELVAREPRKVLLTSIKLLEEDCLEDKMSA